MPLGTGPMKEAEMNTGRRQTVNHCNGQFQFQRCHWTPSKTVSTLETKAGGEDISFIQMSASQEEREDLFHQNLHSNPGSERAFIERGKKYRGQWGWKTDTGLVSSSKAYISTPLTVARTWY